MHTAQTDPHTIYILTGGSGASGEQVVHSVLAQFPDGAEPARRPRVVTVASIRLNEQIDAVIAKACPAGATLVHTFVEPHLRRHVIEQAAFAGVPAIDLMGPLFDRLEHALGRTPVGQPGLYRKLNKAYFDRIAAIDYTMAHDDGKITNDLGQAEIVLTGVSRVGKTPHSMYLAVLGWKTANVPIVAELPLPEILTTLDRGRVIGLTIDPTELIELRRVRQRRMGVSGQSAYIDPQQVYQEIDLAEAFFRRNGFTVIDITDRPMETNADEIIRIITNRYPGSPLS